ncbi:MAG TPA: PhoU domain-containing protein [Thermoplasmata archaeon]|nr:PhoU domain-containing protein [Thermoplasmata archaeon]
MNRRPGTEPSPLLPKNLAYEIARRPDGSRRLQRMGAVTVGVSLPRDWVGQNRLAVGSPVYLRSLSDGSLVVRARSHEELPRIAEISVRVDRPREHLFRRLVAAYLDGAQEFRVHEPRGLSPETRAVSRAFARRTIQPEIVFEEGEDLLLRDVSRGGDLSIPPLLRRMHQVVHRLQEEAMAVFASGGRVAPGDWPRRDDDVDRHAWLIERILTLRQGHGQPDPAEPFGSIPQAFLVVRSLERIADHAVLIAEHGGRWAETTPTVRLVRSVADFHAQARALLDQAFAAAEAGHADLANDILDTGEALHTQYRTLVESTLTRPGGPPLPEAARVELALLLQSIDRTIAYSEDIAEAGLDSGVRLGLTHGALAMEPDSSNRPALIVGASADEGGSRTGPPLKRHRMK